MQTALEAMTLILGDPPVLKILRRVNFGTGRKFGADAAKRYGEGSEMLVFFFQEKEAGKRYGY